MGAPRTFGRDDRQPFLGRDAQSSEPDYSERVARIIDAEIARAVERAHAAAREVLEEHREQLDRAARRLVEKDTLDGEEPAALIEETPAGDTARTTFAI